MQKTTKQRLSTLLREFVPYFINFYTGIGTGLLVTIACTIPLRFLKIIDDGLGSFITGIISMVIMLYIRSWQKGYRGNSATYQFQLRKATLFVAMTFGLQMLLALIIAPTVYISGPAAWLSDYFTSPMLTEGEYGIALHDWLLMLAADILLYGPTMVIGEYLGAKKHSKDFKIQEDKLC